MVRRRLALYCLNVGGNNGIPTKKSIKHMIGKKKKIVKWLTGIILILIFSTYTL